VNKNSQSGAALIMALLLVAIVSAISTGIFFSQRVQIQSETLKETADQAYANAQYAPIWVKSQLAILHEQITQQKQLPIWPQVMPPMSFDDGSSLTAQLIPATSRFNINDLATPVSIYLPVFQSLIQSVDPNINSDMAKKIALNTQAWLTPQSQTGQLSNPYSKLSPPYQAAHQQMASSSELRLVEGMTAPLYQRLRPYIIALPETNTPIDINSAPRMVIMALLDGDDAAADAVLQYRKSHAGFLSNDLFLGLPAVTPYLGKKNQLSKMISAKEATYYLLRSQIKHGKLSFNVQTVLSYDAQKKVLTILRQGQSL
jgi:general secretion pathway protein K